MHAKTKLRRAALLVSGLAATGALAAFGGAPTALATTIYGSGAAVQSSIQSTWISDSGQSNVTYTSTNSGDGFLEFGNFGAGLGLGDGYDKTADTAGQLDAFVAVDNAPTGPESTSGTNLYDAAEAAYASASGPNGEVAIPVAQVPLALLVSLPNDVAVASAQQLDLGNVLAAEAYAGTNPQENSATVGQPYPKGSWGALLVAAGLTPKTSGSPSSGQFVDTGSSSGKTGGYSPIGDEVRTDGAGATLNLTQYFADVDSTDWTSYIGENTDSWPVTPVADNSSDGSEALAVALHPGTIGYATLASATSATDGGFTSGAALGKESGAGSNQILYAFLQDNGTQTSSPSPVYAKPNSGTSANVDTGSDANVNAGGGVGNWIVPLSGGSEVPTGDWATSTTNPSDYTHAWDPDVYGDSSPQKAYYPLVVTLWTLGWSDYNAGKLSSVPEYTSPTGTQTAAQAYLEYVTNYTGGSNSTSGQYAAANGSSYFAELPSNIQLYAYEAAAGL